MTSQAHNRLTQDQFLAKVNARHGNKYDYSQTFYHGSDRLITIICPAHGKFQQLAHSHACGGGCRECRYAKMSQTTRSSREVFIRKSQAIHGVDRYDYSQVTYKGSTNKIKIICPMHGAFEQTPNNHVAGQGCGKCGICSAANTRSLGAELFIQKAQATHGADRYDYSQVVYQTARKKVKIICPRHGSFEQTPDNHLRGGGGRGHGCPTCKKQVTAKRLTLSAATFIAKSQQSHGLGRYDYSQVDYQHSERKVKIICPAHGAFEQTPASHKRGVGCPSCANTGLRWAERAAGRKAVLYLLRIFCHDEIFYKIGVTYTSINERYKRGGIAGYEYEVLAVHSSVNAAAVYDWEQSILETFAHLKYQPLQHFGGESECFSSCEEILSIFPL